MEKFSALLEAWLKECGDFATSNPRQWEEMLTQLFPFGYPDHVEWNDHGQIANVLNLIGKTANLNHLFYPSGGGNDLQEALISKHEPECIEFRAGSWSLAKPKNLSFEGFALDPEWCYFRLELDSLDPCGVYKKHDDESEFEIIREEVAEINDLTYADYSCWNESRFEGKSLPESARPITRWFRGAIVIVQKTSFYNLANGALDAYDGRHNKMNAKVFRQHMASLRKMVIEKEINIRKWRYGK